MWPSAVSSPSNPPLNVGSSTRVESFAFGLAMDHVVGLLHPPKVRLQPKYSVADGEEPECHTGISGETLAKIGFDATQDPKLGAGFGFGLGDEPPELADAALTGEEDLQQHLVALRLWEWRLPEPRRESGATGGRNPIVAAAALPRADRGAPYQPLAFEPRQRREELPKALLPEVANRGLDPLTQGVR